MKILRPFQIQSINLSIASEKTTGNSRRKRNALPAAREQRIVARIKHQAAKHLTFGKRAALRQNKLRRGGRDIKDLDVLQCISQRAVHVSVDRLAEFQHEPVIALVVIGAQIICLGVKGLAGEGKASVEEIRFGNRKKKILSLGAVLETQPELFPTACE